MTSYLIVNKLITGTQDSPQTINFGDLTDINGHTLPSAFVKPFVTAWGLQDRAVNIIKDSTTTTSFQIAASGAGVGGNVYAHITVVEASDPWIEVA